MFRSVVFGIFMELCGHHHYLILESILHLRKKPCTCQQAPPRRPSLQPPIPDSRWSGLCGCLCCLLHTNRIIHHAACCTRLLSFSIVFPRFICVVACVSHGLLSVAEWFSILPSSVSPGISRSWKVLLQCGFS